VLQQPERVSALHDGEHVELAARADEVGNRGVAGLVSGDTPLLVRRVVGRIGHAELGGQLGFGDVGALHGRTPSGEGHDERLVE